MSQGEDLHGQLLKTGCYCMNEDPSHPYTNLFVGDNTLFLQSDADEQLILHFAFNQTVSLKQLILGLPSDESCPRTVKLFVNQNNLGFSDASDRPATQVITLEPLSKPGPVTVPLQAAKWQRVDSITLFIEDNHGSEKSSLHSFKIFGTTVHSVNVSNIRNVGHEG